MKRYENFIIAFVLLILDGYWMKMTLALPQNSSTTIYGPRFFPQVIMAGIFLCALLFLWKGVRQWKAVLEDDDITKCHGDKRKIVALMILFFCYVLLFNQIGFFISSVIYIIIAQIIFGIRNKVVLFLVSPSVILILNVLFVMMFKIPVP